MKLIVTLYTVSAAVMAALSQELRAGAEQLEVVTHSRRRSRDLPNLCCLGPEKPKRLARHEVALKVKRVVDRNPHREQPLG